MLYKTINISFPTTTYFPTDNDDIINIYTNHSLDAIAKVEENPDINIHI